MIKARAARNRDDEVTDRDARVSNSSPHLRFNWLRGRPLSMQPLRASQRRSAIPPECGLLLALPGKSLKGQQCALRDAARDGSLAP